MCSLYRNHNHTKGVIVVTVKGTLADNELRKGLVVITVKGAHAGNE
jgi:hypothetical protein